MDSTEAEKTGLADKIDAWKTPLKYTKQGEAFRKENIKKYENLQPVINEETRTAIKYIPELFVELADYFNNGQPLTLARLQEELERLKLPDIDIKTLDSEDPRYQEWLEINNKMYAVNEIIKLKSSANLQIQEMVEDLEHQALDLWKAENKVGQAWKMPDATLASLQPEIIREGASQIQTAETPHFSEVVIDFSTRDNKLGSGGEGDVWKGTVFGGLPALKGETVSDPENETVAVKIPSTLISNLETKHRVKSFDKEYRILRLLKDTEKRLFPNSPQHFCEVELANVRSQSALVMELIPKKNELYNQCGAPYTKETPLNPGQFQSALNQYFEVLEIVHSLGFSCTDRKEWDIYYFPQQDRLVVLDWDTLHVDEGQKGTEAYDLAVMDDNTRQYNKARVGDLRRGVKFFANAYKYLLESQSEAVGFSPKMLNNLRIVEDSLINEADHSESRTTFSSTESIAELMHKIDKMSPEEITEALRI